MGTQRTAESRWNGLSAEDLSDLSGVDSSVIADRMNHPRDFTLAEVAALAPHLGTTTHAFIGSVLS